MEFEVVIKPLALQDLEDAIKWYQSQLKNLPEKLVSEIDSCLTLISKNPQHYQKRYIDVRIAFLKRFPYGNYYTVETKKIYVHAILHTKQNPRRGIKRI